MADEKVTKDEKIIKSEELGKKLVPIYDEIANADDTASNLKQENANINADTPMGKMLKFGAESSKEYVKNFILSPEFAKAHSEGLIHIHDLDFYSTGTLTCLADDDEITLMDAKGKVFHKRLHDFDEFFITNGTEPEWTEIDGYWILGRNGWTPLKKMMRRIFNTDSETMFNIKTRNGLELRLTENHRVPVLRKGKEKLVHTNEIVCGDELLTEPTVMANEDTVIDIISAFAGSPYEDEIMINNIAKLRDWLRYKYGVINFKKEIGSTTSRNGNYSGGYITIEQFQALKDKYYLPYDVIASLTVKVRNSKNCLPLFMPVSTQLARFMGYIYGDGCVSINEELSLYQVAFINISPALLDDYYECVKSIKPVTMNKRYDPQSQHNGWLFADKLLALLFFRILGHKRNSADMKIPDFILCGNDDIKYAFLSALIDTDGWVEKNGSAVGYGTVCKPFAQQVVSLLATLGIDSTIKTCQTKGTEAHFNKNGEDVVSIRNYDTYKIRISAKFRNILADKLTSIKMTEAENAPVLSAYAYKGEAVTDITPVPYSGFVYDIETAEHWFSVNGYIVHNCCQIDLDSLFERGFHTGHGFLRTPNDITSYAALACIAIQSNQNDQHGGQSVPNFDYALAKGVAKTFIKEYKKAMMDAVELLSYRIEYREDKAKVKADVENLIAVAEGTTSLHARLTMSPEYLLEENRNIQDIGFDEASATRVQNFAYQKAKKETVKATHQAMEALVHNLNTMQSRAGSQVPFSSINLGTDTSAEGRLVTRNLLIAMQEGLGHGETAIFPVIVFKVKEGVNYNSGDPNYDLFKLAMETSAKRLFPNFVFEDAPFNLQYYKPGHPETEVCAMGCRTRVMGNVYDPEREISYGRGNLSFTSINLPRLAIEAKGDYAKFMESLDATVDLAIAQLTERYEFQRKMHVYNFPMLMGQGVWIDSDTLHSNDELGDILNHGSLSVGFIGLAETLVALCGHHHGESDDAQSMGLEIIGHMRSRLDAKAQETHLNYSLLATPAEGLSGRFVNIDRKKYGVIEGVTDREYYTNSFHVPVYYDINAYEKIEKEAPYHNLCNAGHISYIELDGNPSKNMEAYESVIRCMHDAGIGYGSVNFPLDTDPVCGYRGVIKEGCRCPKCGRDENDPVNGERIKFQRIRRVTGYLSGDYETRFNSYKQAEVRDRVKHGLSSGGYGSY